MYQTWLQHNSSGGGRVQARQVPLRIEKLNE